MAQGSILTDMAALDVTVEAAGDLSTKQFLAMKLDSNGRATTAGANEKSLGILQNLPDALGDSARIRIAGVSKAIVSEAVTFGQTLTPTAAGLLEVVDAAGEEIAARSLGVFTTNDQAEVQLGTFGKSQAAE